MNLAPRYAAYNDHPDARRLAAVLHECGSIRLAYLFGSRARAASTRESDIDVAVSIGAPLTAEQKVRIIGDIAAEFGCPVDLIDIETAGGAILGTVFREGIRVLDDAALRERALAHRANWQTDVAPYIERLRAERRAAWLQHG